MSIFFKDATLILNSAFQILRITIVLFVFSFVVKLLKGSDIGSLLVVARGWTEINAYLVEKALSVFLVILSIWLFIKPSILNVFLLLLFLIVYAVIVYENSDKIIYDKFSFLSAMAKWILPLLYLSIYRALRNSSTKFEGLRYLIRFSLFLIFFVHGWSCIFRNPVYIDYIIGVGTLLTGNYIKQFIVENVLIFIGIIDIVVALLVLINPLKWVIGWIIFWGLSTALLRILDGSILNYVEFLVRIPHFILPLVYLILYKETWK